MIYRTHGWVGAGYKPYVFVNQSLLGQMPRGGFYSYEAAPGLLHVAWSGRLGESTSGTKTGAVLGGILTGGIFGGAIAVPMDIAEHRKKGIDRNVPPNQTRYVVFDRGGLKEVPNEQGEEDIAECHWLNPK